MRDYQKAQANGQSISVLANDGGGATQKAISANTTLSTADSGKTILLPATGKAITLPAVATSAELQFKFLCTVTTATSNWTIVAATAVIRGSVQLAGAVLAAAGSTTITLVVAKFLPGDWVSLESDGTNWYVEGSVVTALGVTFT